MLIQGLIEFCSVAKPEEWDSAFKTDRIHPEPMPMKSGERGGVEEVSQPPQVKGHLNKSSQLNTFPDNVAPTPVFFLLLLPVSPTCGGSAPPLRVPSPDASDSMPLIK